MEVLHGKYSDSSPAWRSPRSCDWRLLAAIRWTRVHLLRALTSSAFIYLCLAQDEGVSDGVVIQAARRLQPQGDGKVRSMGRRSPALPCGWPI